MDSFRSLSHRRENDQCGFTSCSCTPQANLFCDYFPAIDLVLNCHIIELFEMYEKRCESELKQKGKELPLALRFTYP